MENIKDILKEELENYKEGLKAELLDTLRKEVKEFVEPSEKEGDNDMDWKEKTYKIVNALAKKDYGLLKTLTEGTDTAGGYLVPDEFRKEIVMVLGQYGKVRKAGARVLPVNSDRVKIPKLSSGHTVYWPGEASSITTSDLTFDQLTMTINMEAIRTSVSTELAEYSVIDIVSLLAQDIAEKFAKEEDNQILTGDGTVFTGILSDTNVNVVQMTNGNIAFSNITFDNLADMIDACDPDSLQNPVFVMHPNIWTILRKKQDAENRYYLGLDKAGMSIWGYPVILSSVMPNTSAADTAFVVFGDFRHIWIGDRRKVKIRTEYDSSTDVDYYVATVRWGYVNTYPDAFAILKTAAS